MRTIGQHAASTPQGGRRSLGILAVAVFLAMLAALTGDASTAGAPFVSGAGAEKDPVTVVPTLPRPTEPRSKAARLSGSPIRIGIPAIQVTADITKLGLNQDGTVEVPKDPEDAGWYRKGPRPGQPGSAVILGHLDSKVGPAVFYRLKHLDRGDRIAVGLDGGTVAHFQVARVAHYANEDFPRQTVYAANPDRPALNLVTCGGKYIREAGGYQSNVVVYTTFLWASSEQSALG